MSSDAEGRKSLKSSLDGVLKNMLPDVESRVYGGGGLIKGEEEKHTSYEDAFVSKCMMTSNSFLFNT